MEHDDYEHLDAENSGIQRPSAGQIETLLREAQRRRAIVRSICSTIGVLIVIAAAVTLIFSLWLPVLQVQRGSMTPTLNDGEVVVFITTGMIRRGDVIAFHHGNQVLIKRVIAVAGDTVDIDGDGTVLLNNERMIEPYVSQPDSGELTASLPCQVPDNQYFVLGDHRQTSIDSRSADIGMIRRDQIIGKALLRIWPPEAIGLIR